MFLLLCLQRCRGAKCQTGVMFTTGLFKVFSREKDQQHRKKSITEIQSKHPKKKKRQARAVINRRDKEPMKSYFPSFVLRHVAKSETSLNTSCSAVRQTSLSEWTLLTITLKKNKKQKTTQSPCNNSKAHKETFVSHCTHEEDFIEIILRS